MKLRVLRDTNVGTATGSIMLKQGQVIGLSKDEAIPLIEAGKIEPLEPVMYRIYSNILEDYLWIVETDQDRGELLSEGATDPVYTGKEIEQMKGMSKRQLQKINTVKKYSLNLLLTV